MTVGAEVPAAMSAAPVVTACTSASPATGISAAAASRLKLAGRPLLRSHQHPPSNKDATHPVPAVTHQTALAWCVVTIGARTSVTAAERMVSVADGVLGLLEVLSLLQLLARKEQLPPAISTRWLQPMTVGAEVPAAMCAAPAVTACTSANPATGISAAAASRLKLAGRPLLPGAGLILG